MANWYCILFPIHRKRKNSNNFWNEKVYYLSYFYQKDPKPIAEGSYGSGNSYSYPAGAAIRKM